MNQYNIKLINDYINGEEIENVEELENDPEFMRKVIAVSGDCKLYNLCSDDVKKNYKFVKFLVTKFSYKVDFITQVADYYFEHSEDEVDQTELVAILIDTIKDRDVNIHYRTMGHAMYYYKRIEIAACLKDEDEPNKYGMGFVFIYDEFMESPIALDYYAKKMIDDIFEEHAIDFEKMLHDNFEEPGDINKSGINNYLLNFISHYDDALSSYASTNIHVLNELNKVIKYIQKRWHSYNYQKEMDMYDTLFDRVHEYINGEGKDMLLDETAAMYYVAKKLGVAKKILDHDPLYPNCSLSDVMDSDEETYIERALELNFRERIHLSKIKKIIVEVMGLDNTKSSGNSQNIIRVDFRNKK